MCRHLNNLAGILRLRQQNPLHLGVLKHQLPTALDLYAELKAVYVDYTGRKLLNVIGCCDKIRS